jgi:hypothetical protein
MDRVRLGRALGFGARQAVKTLVTAVDAATAENPSSKNANRGGDAGRGPQPVAAPGPATGEVVDPASSAATPTLAAKAAHKAAQTVIQTREMRKGLKRGRRRFGEAAWEPFARLSGVLWLEFAGVFFGIFALFAAGGVWKLRGQWHSAATSDAHRQLLGALAMLAVFGYFSVSSFVRARRRERRK